MKQFYVVLFAGVIAAGCSVEKISVPKMRPAEVNMSQYHSIAVYPIDGENGQDFTDELSQAIFNSGRFTVVDDGQSDAILSGQVNKRWYDQTQNSTKGTCYNLKEAYDCYSQVTTGKWNSSVGVRLVDSRSRKLITTKTLQADQVKNASETSQDNSQYPDPDWDVDAVFGDLQHQMVGQFMRAIAPYSVNVQVALFTDSDVPELSRGVMFAKSGDWPNAIISFKTAAEQADSSASAKPQLKARCHYDYAIALGYSGQDFALADREIAQAISIKPEQVFYQERTKIATFKKDDETLKKDDAASNSGAPSGRKASARRGNGPA